jgi:hypothetical protein
VAAALAGLATFLDEALFAVFLGMLGIPLVNVTSTSGSYTKEDS